MQGPEWPDFLLVVVRTWRKPVPSPDDHPKRSCGTPHRLQVKPSFASPFSRPKSTSDLGSRLFAGRARTVVGGSNAVPMG